MQVVAWSPHPDHRGCYTACYRPCQLEYTHLLRYERLAEDWSLFLEDAGLQGAGLGLGWHNRGQGAASASGYWDQVSIVTRDPANQAAAGDQGAEAAVGGDIQGGLGHVWLQGWILT